jgi:hypothetical protein
MSEIAQLADGEYDKIINQMIACPFCGRATGDIYVVHFHHWVCSCVGCDSRGPISVSPQKALESWNKRWELKLRNTLTN